MPPPLERLGDIALHFPLHGALREAKPYGSGHINDTFLTCFNHAGAQVRYILQRINHRVFKNVPQLMENISRVTLHLAGTTAATGHRRTLTLVPTLGGKPFHETPAGEFWRVYLFIEGARTYDRVESPRQAFEAARAFGLFQRALADLAGRRRGRMAPMPQLCARPLGSHWQGHPHAGRKKLS